ncbi:hypothetical protein ACFUGD_00035 [Streptomyces sp. NPDC057217]|uniref:hypothetical protein n=1 Tax=Streptomyces sp. NPDC057217 TaxID=3346054 RepID=UPI003639D9D4
MHDAGRHPRLRPPRRRRRHARRPYPDPHRRPVRATAGHGDAETGPPTGCERYATDPARPGWLLLASDGAQEPREDVGHDLGDSLNGDPREAADRLVDDAVRRSRAQRNPNEKAKPPSSARNG